MMVATAAAGYVYQQNQAEESLLSELAMANVEALAYSERDIEELCEDDTEGRCFYYVVMTNNSYPVIVLGMRNKI